jgi:hypothetical protein
MKILTSSQYSKITWSLMISMNFLRDPILLLKQRSDYQSFVAFMINTHKYFQITWSYLRVSTCLRTSKENRSWLMNFIKFKKSMLKGRVTNCLMKIDFSTRSFTIVCISKVIFQCPDSSTRIKPNKFLLI